MHTKDYLRLLFTIFSITFIVVFSSKTSHATSFTEGYLTYTENTDGSLTVTGYTAPEDMRFPDITINNVINSKQVTAIADSVFQNQEFSNVFIDNNILIGKYAFNNSSVNSLTIGSDNSGSNVIDKYAFADSVLYNIYINSNIEIYDYAFKHTSFHYDFIHNESSILTSIGKEAFMNSSYIEGLNYSSLISIGENAFYNTKINTFTIPSTINEIGKSAFDYDYTTRTDRLKIYIDSSITDIANYHFEDLDSAILGIDAQSPLIDYCVTNNIPHFLTNESETSTSKANVNQVLFNDSYTIMINGDNTATLLSLFSKSDSLCINEQYDTNYHGHNYRINKIDKWAISNDTCPYANSIILGSNITQLNNYSVSFHTPHTITLSENLESIDFSSYFNADSTTIIIPPSLTVFSQQMMDVFSISVAHFLLEKNSPLITFFEEKKLNYKTYEASDSDSNNDSDNQDETETDFPSGTTFTAGYLTYITNEDGTLTVTGYDPEQYANQVPLEIKNTVNGKTVSRIAERAFRDKCFEYVAIDDNIEIGDFAFQNAKILGKLTDKYNDKIPECYNYNLYIGNSNEGYNKIGDYAFVSAIIDRIIVFKSNISIGDSAFKNATFQGIYQPESEVYNIGKNAFDGSPYTSGLNYNALVSVGSDAFNGCRLTEFTISPTLQTFDTTFTGGTYSQYFHLYIADGVNDVSSYQLEDLKYTIFHITAASPLGTYFSSNNMQYVVDDSADQDYVYSKPGTGQILTNDMYKVQVTGDSTAKLLCFYQPANTFNFVFDQNAVVDYHGYQYTITEIADNAFTPETCSYFETLTFGDTITNIAFHALNMGNYDISKIVLTSADTVIATNALPDSEYLTIELLPSVTTIEHYNIGNLLTTTFLVEENSPLIPELVAQKLTVQTPGNEPVRPGSPNYPNYETDDEQTYTTEEPTTGELTTEKPTTESSTDKNTTETLTTDSTSVPDTDKSTNETPTTEPSTDNNTTEMPTTDSSSVPDTDKSTNETPTTEPSTDNNTTETPTTDSTNIPDTDKSTNETPTTEPSTDNNTTETPTTESAPNATTEMPATESTPKATTEMQDTINPATTLPTTEAPDIINSTTVPPVADADTQTKKRPVKGTIIVSKKLQYKVTGKNTVSFLKPQSKKLTSLTLPATITYNGYQFKVTQINQNACYQCPKLKTVTIGNNITTIGDNSFAKCSSLQSIQFGKNVKKLGRRTLYQNRKLGRIIFKGTKLQSIGTQTFRSVPKTVDIIVPNSKVGKYSQLINNAT